MHRRVSPVILHINVGAFLEQQGDAGYQLTVEHAITLRSPVQRRLPSLAASVDVGALLDQQFRDGHIPKLHGELERRLVGLIGALIDVAAVVQEDLHHGFPPGQHSAVERRLPCVVVRVDVDVLVFQEETGHLLVVDEDGVVQWCLVEGVADIYLGAMVDQDLGQLFESLFGSPVERGDVAALMSLGDEEGGLEEWYQEDEVWTGFEEIFETGFVEVGGDLLEELVGEIEEWHDRRRRVWSICEGGGRYVR